MSDVSRETPPAPASARGVFPSAALSGIERYAALLADEGVVRGLIGPREVPRLWDRHLVNSGLLTTLVPEQATLADVGSGAGLPGLVVALARPDVTVTLVEPLLRRTTFLQEAVAELGLTNVEVVRGRADALHGSRRFDVVASRAVAPLEKLTSWCLPLVGAGGRMLAMKGSSAQDEIDAAASQLSVWGAAPPVLETVGDPDGPQITVVVVRWSDPERVSWRLGSAGVRGPGSSTKDPGRRRRDATRDRGRGRGPGHGGRG